MAREFAMKRKRFSVEQIVAVLNQAEAGLQSDQVRELKLLQDENARLKKLVAELSLDKAILQDVNSKKWPGPR